MNHVQLQITDQADTKQNDKRMEEAKAHAYIPLIAGSTARLLASLATAPLELIRTRQANDPTQFVLRTGFRNAVHLSLACRR